MTDTTALTRRHEFVLFFDVRDGNPNGDPDAGNLPRMDPETNHGLVSDVALKRKIRNYVALVKADVSGHEIYIRDGATLNVENKRAWTAIAPGASPAEMKKGDKGLQLTRWMCGNFWDVRSFGAVMSTGVNSGQVRGPVQLAFARSVEPILPLEISITRLAATTEADAEAKGDRTMGRKHIVPYGLYRAHGFVSASLASHPAKGTGFSNADLDLLFEALANMFEHDRSAARSEMATRKLIVFRHASALGNAQAHDLFDRVTVARVHEGKPIPIGGRGLNKLPPARGYADYTIAIDRENLPEHVEILEM